jgi:phosphate-selective porin
MLRKLVFSFMAVIALSLVAMAQGGKITLTGYIIDKACSVRLAKKSDPQSAAAEEPTSCALMEGCVKSGFGIFADGKYIEFDEKGGALAKAALEKSKKDKGAKFKVTGKVTGDKVAVEKIEEVM